MKKTKFILAIATLIFCLFGPKVQQADAASSIESIYQGGNFSSNSCLILDAGYYIITADDGMSEQNFDGDFAYYKGKPNQANETFLTSNLEYRNEDLGLIKELFQNFNNDGGYILYSGLIVVYVRSYAVFINTNDFDLGYFTMYYARIAPKNTNTNISGGMTHSINFDSPLTIEQIKVRYQAYDNVDGDLTSQIQFKTNYNPDNAKYGKYYIMASVTDSSKNKTVTIDYILVNDFASPILSLSQSIVHKEVYTVFTSADAKKLFSATDNACTPRIIYNDKYNSNYNKLGTYTISAYASDVASNKSDTKTLTIIIEDTTIPDVVLKNGGDTIIADHQLNDEEILDLFDISDNYDKLTKADLEIVGNNCNGDEGKEFIIQIKVTDKSGNNQTKSFKYYLTDTHAPIITVKDVLYLEAGISYTNEQIINMLKQAGYISYDATNITMSSNYICTEDDIDIYQLVLTENNDETSTKEIILKVFHNETLTSKEKRYNYGNLMFLIPLLIIAFISLKRIKIWQK